LKISKPLATSTAVRWALVALLVVTAAVYSPALRAPFEFDDASAITSNESLRSLAPSIALRPPENTSVSGRPVANFTFALNAAVNRWLGVDERPDPGGPNKTLGLHIVNLLLHMWCGLLIFGTIRRTVANARERRASAIDPDITAFLTAAIWMLHPIQTEAVDYLVQRTEILVSLCYLGTLYASNRAWSAASERRRIWWYVGAVVICLLGMGSKEVMITAPFIVILYDRAFRFETWSEQARSRRIWFYLALIGTSSLLLINVASNARSDTVGFHLGVTWQAYLYSQAWAVAHYLRLLVWPSGLTLDYGTRPVAGTAGIPGALWLSACFVATITAWTRVGRWGWLAFLGAWFFIILAPSSSVVPIATEIAAERRVYLAMVAPVLLFVIGVFILATRVSSTKRASIPIAALGAIALALGAVSFNRSALFKDPETLWRDAVKKAPDNPRVYDNLAATMFFTDPPKLMAAKELYTEALRLDSTYVHAYSGLASVAIDENRFADAVPILERALAIDSGYSVAVNQLGNALLRTGHPDRAVPYLEKYARAYPSENSLMSLAMAQLQAGKYSDAASVLERVLAENAKFYEAMRLLGGALVEAGRGADAVPWLERLATNQQPTPIGIGLLALAYAQAGRPNDALRAASAASADAGDNAGAHLLAGRAALLANDATSAEQYFSAAYALAPRSVEAATLLGLAEQKLGKSNAAAVQFRRALSIDPTYAPAQQGLRAMK
jgi:tetratricopeptide (TPR) repeat protein